MTYSFRTYLDRDEAALEALLKSTFRSFKQKNYWLWKYKSNPNFDPSLVVLAEKDGQLIGCNHWLPRNIKLSSNLQVRAVLAADVAVDPAYRGQGVGKELVGYLRSSGTFEEKGIVISYMFTKPKLNKGLYQPTAGYFLLPTCATTYKKLFNCDKLREKFQKIDQAIKSSEKAKKKLEGLNLAVGFKLKGAPEFTLHIKPDGVRLDEGKPQKPDVFIEGNLPLSASIIDGDAGTGDLVKAWITGKIKVKKGLRNIFKMRRAFKIMQTASS